MNLDNKNDNENLEEQKSESLINAETSELSDASEIQTQQVNIEKNELSEQNDDKEFNIDEETRADEQIPENCESYITDTLDDSNKYFTGKIRLPNKKIAIICLSLICSLVIIISMYFIITSKTDHINVTYSGATGAGTVLDTKNTGFSVSKTNKRGDVSPVSDWVIETPETLQPDSSSKVTILYKKYHSSIEVKCSSSVTSTISLLYTGSREAGSYVNKDTCKIYAVLKDGSRDDVTDKCELIPESTKLEKDGKYKIGVRYKDPYTEKIFESVLDVVCSTVSVKSISAKYTGSTEAGTAVGLSVESNIKVTATYVDGSVRDVTGFKVDSGHILLPDETVTLTITYDGKSCDLEITCTTMSKERYKNSCRYISYEQLARYPNRYIGEKIYLNGEVIQAMPAQDSLHYGAYRVNVTYSGSGRYEDTVYLIVDDYDEELRILEDDNIDIYGEYVGLKTYETVLGSSVTIPCVKVKYITINS